MVMTDELLIHSLGVFLFLNLETVGQKKSLMSLSRKKLNLKLNNNLQLQRERADKKVFELIKETTGLFFGRDVFVGFFQNICACFHGEAGRFVVNLPYDQGRREKCLMGNEIYLSIILEKLITFLEILLMGLSCDAY